jgi:hypothetical protein
VRIAPPPGVTFWVKKSFLTGQEVNAALLNVRSGAGENHSVVGQLNRGDKVEVLGEKEEWAQIKARDGLSLWISRPLVKLPEFPTEPVRPRPPPRAIEPPAPEPAPVPEAPLPPAPEVVVVPPTPEPPPVQPVQPEEPRTQPAPPAPADLNLVPLPGQGTPASRQGTLRSYLIKGDSPSRYHLVIREGGGEETVCYLKADEARLKALTGRRVIVRGWDYWVQGKKLPVMVPASIEPVAVER